MKFRAFILTNLTAAIALASAALSIAQAADAPAFPLQRLALCQDSWLEWKDDATRMRGLASQLEAQYKPNAQGGGAYDPKASTQLLGWQVTQVYPQSVGMGVGFSALVNADFATARAGVEKATGKKLSCSTSDGFTACEGKLAEKKTITLMTGDNGKGKTSLVGCYYYYEK